MKHVLGRVGRTTAGVLLVLIGIVLVPLPGPGFLVIFAGLLLLARDYAWAQRLVDRARTRAEQAGRSARRFLTSTRSTQAEPTPDLPTNGDHS
jgi:uncharacterized protein (TIGR02611 family)